MKFLTITAIILTLCGCSMLTPSASLSISLPSTARALDSGTRVLAAQTATYQVTLTGASLSAPAIIYGVPGEDLLFDDLEPGTYTVDILAESYNGETYSPLLSGSATAAISPGKNNVAVALFPVNAPISAGYTISITQLGPSTDFYRITDLLIGDSLALNLTGVSSTTRLELFDSSGLVHEQYTGPVSTSFTIFDSIIYAAISNYDSGTITGTLAFGPQ